METHEAETQDHIVVQDGLPRKNLLLVHVVVQDGLLKSIALWLDVMVLVGLPRNTLLLLLLLMSSPTMQSPRVRLDSKISFQHNQVLV